MKLVAAYKSGRAFNGAHRDAGIIVHLVPPLPDTVSRASFWGDKALCGVKPGRRGNGWADAYSEVNCEKCIRKDKLSNESKP